ncbi:hypothetical protein [Tenacibaculum ovolyticum]|uniref:hypothetical protein n=1 Tax=Tenacibaculum ovolyticum TaxID=104270 RepID=UPI0007ECD861|nr:hypothetical protein [Tenacibaculum ovolyticum]
MRRILIFLLIIACLSSCSKSVYYAYKDENKYATIEVTKKNELFYRAIYDNNYIYIYSFLSYKKDNSIFYLKDPNIMFWKREEHDEFDLCFFSGKNEDFVLYEKQGSQNMWKLSRSISDNLLLNEPCLKENNIDWFPEYMVKVDKIDYEKFNLPHIKKKYLKNPKKAPKVYE